MPVTWATVLARLKETLIDQSLDFWKETRLREWYDDGAQMQHRMILENAMQTGKLQGYNNDYLKYFLKESPAAAFTDGERDYALPADFYMLISAEIEEADENRVHCRTASINDDWRIRNLQNWKPIPERPYAALTDDGKCRFYFASADMAPHDPTLKYAFMYYRDVLRTTGVNVDLLDPWNIGPQAFAVAKAVELEGRDPSHWFAQAQAAASVIMPAPVQAAR